MVNEMKKKEKRFEFRIISLASLSAEEHNMVYGNSNKLLLSKKEGDVGFSVYRFLEKDRNSALRFGMAEAFMSGWSSMGNIYNVYEIPEE